jgi:hypothetical protein
VSWWVLLLAGRYVRGSLLMQKGFNSGSRIAIDYVVCHVILRCFGTVGKTGMVTVRRKEAMTQALLVYGSKTIPHLGPLGYRAMS